MPTFELRFLDWPTLERFQTEQSLLNTKDVDNVLRLNPYSMHTATTYGVYVDGELAGFARIAERHLRTLYIAPKHRRLGLASYVLRELKVLSLWVVRVNHAAINAYRKAGFEMGPKAPANDRYFMSRSSS